MRNIIGITGNKGHGKDTAANTIKLFLGKDTQIFSFAKPLKIAVSTLFNINENYFEDQQLKELPLSDWDDKTPRQLLQWLGTDVLRKYDTDIFIKNMEKRIENTKNDIIVSDVRFDNEANLIHRLGGKIIQIDSTERLGRCNDSHITEYGINPGLRDITVYNNSDKVNLEMELFKIVNEFKND